MISHRVVTRLACLAALLSCDKNGVQQLPLEPLAGAQMKFFNFGLNAPGVNFYADNAKVGTTSDPLGVRYSFAAANGAYTAIAPGQYTFAARIATGANKDTTISSLAISVEDGKSYSYYLSGLYNSSTRHVDAFVLEDSSVAAIDTSIAYVRFVNTMYNSGPLSLNAANTFTHDTLALGSVVIYKAASAFTPIPTGVYDLFVPITDTTAITRAGQSFLGAHLYTITARGDITITSSTATNRPFLDNTPNR
jgi:hypothetical protein